MGKAGKAGRALASAPAAEPSGRGLEFKLRLPPDIAGHIRARAEQEGRPQNRIIINALADYFGRGDLGTLSERIRDIETLLARYGSRISGIEIAERVWDAHEAILKAEVSMHFKLLWSASVWSTTPCRLWLMRQAGGPKVGHNPGPRR